MDCIDHGVAKSQTPLSNFHFQGRCSSRRPQELTPSRQRRCLHTRAGSSAWALNCRLLWARQSGTPCWYLTGHDGQEAGLPEPRFWLPVTGSQGQEGSPLFSFFFQHTAQDTTLHLVIMPPKAALDCHSWSISFWGCPFHPCPHLF